MCHTPTLEPGYSRVSFDQGSNIVISSQLSHKSQHQLKVAGLLATIVIVSSLLVHKATVSSIISLWARSETFSHGFLVFPIAMVLIWLKHKQLARVLPRPNFTGLLAVSLLSFLWFLAEASNIQVIQHFAVVAMVPVLVWTLLGKQVFSKIKFPLFFLFFAVPAGEILIPILMNFTVEFTVKAVTLSGVPVYRDGLFFSIPSGDFEIAKACSGIRYLIASVALGTLYAYLSYRSLWRRAIFVFLCVLVPIIANGIRAYGIVMIAYLSDMKYAQGIDHVIYGWLFFGFVMSLLFWAGNSLREKDSVEEKVSIESDPKPVNTGLVKTIIIAVAAMVIVISGPLTANYLSAVHQAENIPPLSLALPRGQNSWDGPKESSGIWKPHIAGADLELKGRYQDGQSDVEIYVFYFSKQAQDLEMVNFKNRVYDGESWSMTWEDKKRVVMSDGKKHNVISTSIRSSGNNRLVWHWYNISGRATASRTTAKLYEVLALLSASVGESYMVAISAEYQRDSGVAEGVLRQFMSDNYEAIKRCMTVGEQYEGVCVKTESVR